jgi:TPR repeat protein
MNNLGIYYYEQKEYKKMEKYYLMAIKKGDSDAMNLLGDYYRGQKEYEKMENYYLMAIEKGDSKVILKLENHYRDHNKTNELIKLYYEHINKNDNMDKLINIMNSSLTQSKTDDSIDYGNIIKIITSINFDNKSNVPKFMILLKKSLEEKVDLYELHFKYAPTSAGYEHAKEDFATRIIK